ncbi:MAG: diacylglycerol kinase [Actinomycetota bacterium]|jgi:diacylglycerol kinase family enzyme|nr:diacylglycerol kinase [Actinomycetota bacterium]MEA2580493.1 diacylglycerol kinase [Actinomycetota bacterium]
MTSPFGTLHVLADALAGDGAVRAKLPDLERALAARDLDYRLTVSTTPAQLREGAARALGEGARYVVAVGSDASVHHVINGMFADGEPLIEDPVIGVLGAGARCDIMRTMGIPDDFEMAVDRLAGDSTYPFDVMKITYTDEVGGRGTLYGHNLVEAGLGGRAAKAAARFPRWLGNAGQFLGFWSAWLRSRPSLVKVDADRKAFEGRAFNVVVANAQYTGGGVRLSPRSFPGDGVLDALIFKGPRSDAYTMLPRIYQHGGHIPDPNIQEFRAKIRVAVDAPTPWPVVVDQIVIGTTPVTIQIVPQRILMKL